MRNVVFFLLWVKLALGIIPGPSEPVNHPYDLSGEIMREVKLFEIPEDEVYHDVGALYEWFSPLAVSDDHIFFVYITPTQQVKLVHLALVNGAAHLISNSFLVHAEYTVHPHWYINMYSVGLDELGYLHVSEGMNEYPDEGYPAWRGSRHPDYANHKCLMWRSVRPRDSGEMEFVGGTDAGCPGGDGYARLKFFNDNSQRLYVHYRAIVQGAKSGLFNLPDGYRGLVLSKFDTSTKKWTMIAGDVPETDGYKAFAYEVPRPTDSAGAWSHFPCQVIFDRDDVLHTWILMNGEEGQGRMQTSVIYSYSADYGRTWHRADGTEVKLPMKVYTGGEHKADVALHNATPLRYSMGFAPLQSRDLLGFVLDLEQEHYHVVRHKNGEWVDSVGSQFPVPRRNSTTLTFPDNKNIQTQLWGDGIRRFWNGDDDIKHHPYEWDRIRSDPMYTRRTGRLIGLTEFKRYDVKAPLTILMIDFYHPDVNPPVDETSPPGEVADPTVEPQTTEEPTREPTEEPTREPTREPTEEPTPEPTEEPTEPAGPPPAPVQPVEPPVPPAPPAAGECGCGCGGGGIMMMPFLAPHA